MNLILFDQEDRVEEGLIRLEDHRLDHLREVLDTSPGDTLRVGEINGQMGEAFVENVDRLGAELRYTLDQEPPAKIPLTLVVALPRPKMLRRILRMVAEFGVAELHLINSYRVEKSYWQTPVLEETHIEQYFLEGLSQSRDTVLPELFLHSLFKPFVEDELPGLLENRKGFIAQPGPHPAYSPPRENSLLCIGPEGGWIHYEVEKMREAGCQAVSLGQRILRVENAVASLLGRFQQP